jgi:hypothetical protein
MDSRTFLERAQCARNGAVAELNISGIRARLPTVAAVYHWYPTHQCADCGALYATPPGLTAVCPECTFEHLDR